MTAGHKTAKLHDKHTVPLLVEFSVNLWFKSFIKVI
jgi:hypothetical protein